MIILSFGFRGLPFNPKNYISENKYFIRKKIKSYLSSLGIIRKLYINENNNYGRFLLELEDENKGKLIEKVICAINDSPIRMLKFSWEQPLLKMEKEESYLLPYKSWLFLEFDNSYEKTKQILNSLIRKQELLANVEFDKFLKEEEFELACQEWLLSNN